jgi:glycosyltransferase 2 family protein
MKKLLEPKLVVSLLVSGVAVWQLLSSVNFAEVSTQLKACKPVYLSFAIAMVIAHLWIRGIRWKMFLPTDESRTCSTKLLFDGLGVSNFCNYLLPLRAGEFLRAWFVSLHSKFTVAEAISTVVIERLFDLLVVLSSFSLLWYLGTDFHPLILTGAKLLSFAALALSLGLVSVIFWSEAVWRLLNLAVSKLPNQLDHLGNTALTAARQMIDCSRKLEQPKSFFSVCGLSLIAWATNYASIYFFLGAVGIPVTPLMAVTSGVIIALAVAAPALPGFIGVYQWASIIGLGLFDVSPESATAFSILSHISLYALYIGYGLWILNHYTLSFKSLTRATKEQATISN